MGERYAQADNASHDIKDWKCMYLIKMQDVMAKGMPKFSFDETYADSDLTSGRVPQAARDNGYR